MHNGCILLGGTGSGKSLTSLGYVRKVAAGKHIYIITIAKKRESGEWFDDIRKIEMDESMFTVDSWNNLKKYKDVKDAFFIFDEQKASGHGRWAKLLITITKSNQWILLTATPGDDYDDYATILIANKFIKNKTEWNEKYCKFDRNAKYPKIVGYQHEDKIREMINLILVKMDYVSDKEHKIHLVRIGGDSDEERYILRKRCSLNNPLMRPFETLSGALAYIRMNCPDRTQKQVACEQVFGGGNKYIVFYNFVSEKFEIERAAINAELPFYQYNGQVHDPVPQEDSWVYAVHYFSAAEAWNCPTCDTIIFYSLNYSYKYMVQAAGRIDRVNSPFDILHYYILYCPDLIIDRGIMDALKRKETFNEKTLEGVI